MKLKFQVTDDRGDEREIELPGRFEVCPTCAGKGTRVNPAIDGNGLTAEDLAEDPDFAEGYFAGVYDIQCDRCGGQRVVEVVDVDTAKHTCPEDLRLYQEHEIERIRIEAEIRNEQRFGY